MSKRVAILVVAVAAAVFGSAAADGGARPESFDEFRRGLLGDYAVFRDDILKNYASFLDGVWVEYDRFRGKERDPNPKPVRQPVAVADKSVDTPAAHVPAAEERVAPAPEPAPADVCPAQAGEYQFDFYGVPMSVPEMEVRVTRSLSTPTDFGNQWRALDSDPSAAAMAAEFKALARRHNFNDWLTYELVRQWADARYGRDCHSTSRMALVHYLLTHMGYAARVALGGDGEGLLLLPFTTMVYGIPYLNIDGVKYFIFADGHRKVNPSVAVTTCRLPDKAEAGAALSLKMTAPADIPFRPHDFRLSAGGIELRGTVNANLFPMLYRYPQMELGGYSDAVLEPALRISLVEQMKAQLEGMSELEAVNALLQFTQSALKYATDDENHGFEKPYFLEETLFYDKCDCEDRAIFYTYMLWHVLGVENHMINFPGHESAAVRLHEPIQGDSYDYSGETFYISDPTYIGAPTGMCMPDYRRSNPTVDHVYR